MHAPGRCKASIALIILTHTGISCCRINYKPETCIQLSHVQTPTVRSPTKQSFNPATSQGSCPKNCKGRKPANSGDAKEKRRERKKREGAGSRKAPRPRAPRAGNNEKAERRGAKRRARGRGRGQPQSAKAQDAEGWKPEKARDSGAAGREANKKERKKESRRTKGQERGSPRPEGAEQYTMTKRPKES